MKNIIIGLLIFTSNIYSQKSIKMEKKYHPNTEYSYDSKINTNSTSEYFSESAIIIDRLKSSGKYGLTKIKKEQIIPSKLSTGNLKNEEISFSIKYGKIDSEIFKNDELTSEDDLMSSLEILGKITNQNVKIDTILADKIPVNLKTSLIPTLEKNYNNNSLYNRNLSVGESYVIKTPYSIPIPNTEKLKAFIENTYTLKKIRNNKAYFNVEKKGNFNFKTANLIIEGQYIGTGEMIYDIKNNFIIKTESETKIELEADLNTFLKIKTSSTTNTLEIVKIKSR